MDLPKRSQVERVWKEFERQLILERYSLRSPEGSPLEKTYQDVINRVCQYLLSLDEKKLKESFELVREVREEVIEALQKLFFVPATPILMNFGSPAKWKTYFSCFPLGPVEDSIEGIFEMAKKMALIFRTGGGVGIDVSKLRPRGAPVNKGQGESSGPCSFMYLYGAVTGVVEQGGRRRGALMIQMDAEHPDWQLFCTIKDDITLDNPLNHMNISLNVNNFKQFEKEGKLDFVAEHAWKTGDPGVIFVENAYGLSTIDLKYEPKYSNPCLVEGTLLFDGDRLRRIEEGGKLWRSWSSGVKEVVRVFTADGNFFDCTPEHKFWTIEGWVEAKDLQGKYLVLFEKDGVERFYRGKIELNDYFEGLGRAYTSAHQFTSRGIRYYHDPTVGKLLEPYFDTLSLYDLENHFISRQTFEKWNIHQIASFLRGVCQVALKVENGKAVIKVGGFHHWMYRHLKFMFAALGIFAIDTGMSVEIEDRVSIERINEYLKLDLNPEFFPKKDRITAFVYKVSPAGQAPVYDYQMYDRKTFNAIHGGYICRNCGEYLSVANTVCNLHAINLPEIYRQAERQNMDFYQLLFDTAKQATHFANLLLYLDEGFPLPDLIPTTREIRPIGIGLTGYHCYLLQRGLRYSDSVEEAKRVMATILLGCAEASTLWGRRISSCKALRKEQMSNMLEEAKLVSPVGNDVSFSVDDLHNGYLNIVHPTGSVSQLVHVGATGIEPLYSLKTRRIYRSKGDWKEVELIPLELYETSLDLKDIEDDCALNIAPKAQIEVMSAFQKFCTLAISKTVNLPQSASVDEIKELIRLGYEKGLKALTVFRDKCREIQVLSTSSSKTSEPVSLPDVREGRTYSFKGPRTLYVTVNRSDNKPVEVFINTGKLGSLPTVFAQALGRVISVILQQNPNVVKRIVETLKGLEHELYLCRLGDQIIKAKSIPDAVALVLEKELELELDKEMGYDVCPICGFTSLRRSGGCSFCENCGYSSC